MEVLPSDGACDLCGATHAAAVADASAARCRIVMCPGCRLLYASPSLSQADLDILYEENFDGDAGSPVRAGSGLPDTEKIRSEEKRAGKWALPIIRHFMAIDGKQLLDLRCRSGALSAALVAHGAHVLGVDPFEANVRYAQQVRGLSQVAHLPFSSFHDLGLACQQEWDAVSVLTEHVLAHVVSPRTLLANIFGVLRPGGYLFLDEKDVLRPARYQTRSVFDSGPAHQYQLTVHTTASYLQSVGFELLECEIDTQRVSSHQHIRVVARKPGLGNASVRDTISLAGGPTAEQIIRQLRWLERTWRLSRARRETRRTLHRLMRRLRSR